MANVAIDRRFQLDEGQPFPHGDLAHSAGEPMGHHDVVRQLYASGARMSAASVTVLPRRTPPTDPCCRRGCPDPVSCQRRAAGLGVQGAGGRLRPGGPDRARCRPGRSSDPGPRPAGARQRLGRGSSHPREAAPTKMILTSEETDMPDGLGPFVRKPYQAAEVAALAAHSLNWPQPPQA